MKIIVKILIISTLSIFSCQKDVKDLIDKTAIAETPPVHTPDSPMWKLLASPSKTRYIDGVFSTEKEDLYNCVMARRDTVSDHLEIDNINTINMFGSIDAQTTMNGTYYPEYNGWFVQKTDATPRYSPILLGPFGYFRAGETAYFTLFGSGYSTNESFPNGFRFIKDWWLMSDYNQTGDIVNGVALSGFMANNKGYFVENNDKKQAWKINNGEIYEKIKPFSGNFLGKFLTTGIKLKNKGVGFLLSESSDEKIKTKEFYQYDTDKDTWTRKADFAGEDRQEGVLFGIDDKIYYGLGQSKTDAKGFRDIWQYDTQTDKWSRFATYPGSGNIKVATAQVAGKVYIGMGYYVGSTSINTEKYIGTSDFWEFVPSRK